MLRLESSTLSLGTICSSSPIGRGPGLNPGKYKFEACEEHHARVADRKSKELRTLKEVGSIPTAGAI